MTGKSIQISPSFSSERRKPKSRPSPSENESANRIVASLAHEINNPLEALHQVHYLIEKEGTLTEKGRQCLAIAHEEVERISRILHAAMELRDASEPEETDVPELLGSVLSFYASRFAFRGIDVKTRYRSGLRLAVYPRQLRQMCTNLLLNAADAMPSGGKIYARIAPAHNWKPDRKHGLRFTFADTGCGIAAKHLAQIWDPFFTTKGPAGNGIGLSLVKDTVHKHHGVLRVRSSTKAGHSGTVFSIFLPCA